jgi:hypothetical protein
LKSLARPGDRAELLARLRRLQADTPRRWGAMSASGMVCHLADALRPLVGEKPLVDRSTLLDRTLVKWMALYLPLRWPSGIPTTPEFDQLAGGTAPAAFGADVVQLERLLARVTAEPRRLHRQRHPRFGPLSTRAWLRWGYLHVDHHLRQFGL